MPWERLSLRSRALVAIVFLLGTHLCEGALVRAELSPKAPEVEIKKHSTGKEATIRQGDKEWFILIDVDQDRTMIIRTESEKGQELQNHPEIVDRPMSNSEVDLVINDFVSGIKSTLKP